MIDFSNIEKYRENNRIEAKRSMGGLPKSLWETYSAFANTLGGILVLGLEEYKDRSLHPLNLPAPEKLVAEFWEIINNPHMVSVNILSDEHVSIKVVNGKRIIVISVPRAQRYDKPVYINGNPFTGTYRRNGEGDYRCTHEEVQAMIRDAAVKTQDMDLISDMDLDVLDYDSLQRYRIRMEKHRPGHLWESFETDEFLCSIGAAGKDKEGNLRPTAAGLLMFGYEREIVKVYPDYLLDYEEKTSSHRILSSSGDWSGNIYDFFFLVYDKMVAGIKVMPVEEDGEALDEAMVHSALREALVNGIVNADYHGSRGLVIVREKNKITISNPGGFRINVDNAKSGGVSDPRNAALFRMFNLINIGQSSGSGLPGIYRVWRKQHWKEPTIMESFGPERITLTLAIENLGDENPAVDAEKKKIIIDYLTDHASGKTREIARYIDLKPEDTQNYLSQLLLEDIIVAEGSHRNTVYKLKS